MAKSVTLNVVGVGYWGPKLIRNFLRIPEVRIRTVADIKSERLEEIGRQFPDIELLSNNPEAALRDPNADGVIIATPVHTHGEFVRRAIEYGKDVFVEKPLCCCPLEAAELVAAAQARGVLLCVGHVYMFHPSVLQAKSLIQSGELGSVRYLTATRTNFGPIRHDVSALWDLGCHDVGVFLDWLQSDPVSVTARGQSFLLPDIEDLSFATYTFPNGVLAHVKSSWLSLRKVREITVVGDTGMLVLDDMNPEAPLTLYRHPLRLDDCGSGLHGWTGAGTVIREEQVRISCGEGEPLAHECRHFVECVISRSEPINSGAFALRVLRTLEAAERSTQNHSQLVRISAPQHALESTIPV